MISCPPTVHHHEPMSLRCEGCQRKTGPDDFIRTAAGRTAICPACWEKWRAGGYGRRGGRA